MTQPETHQHIVRAILANQHSNLAAYMDEWATALETSTWMIKIDGPVRVLAEAYRQELERLTLGRAGSSEWKEILEQAKLLRAATLDRLLRLQPKLMTSLPLSGPDPKDGTRSSLAEINITPLVDVVLVLLVIFMITAPVLQSGIQVNVPKTRTVSKITEQRMVVAIDAQRNIYLNDKQVNIRALPSELRPAGVDPAHEVVYLESDQTVPFQIFCDVLDAVTQSGITNVSIITQPRNTQARTARK